jgi:ribosomal protein S10
MAVHSENCVSSDLKPRHRAKLRVNARNIKKAVKRAITELRGTYRTAVNEEEWVMLAQVARTKQMPNEDAYRKLLFNRCILEYRYLDAEGEISDPPPY